MTPHVTRSATPTRPSRPRRRVAALSTIAVAAALVVAPSVTGAGASGATTSGAAPGAPGTPSTWALGDHDGFGTARGTKSKVWYTLRKGKLTDVYYPRIDTPSIRDSQFVVVGKGFTDREDLDARSRVELLDSRSLVYRRHEHGEVWKVAHRQDVRDRPETFDRAAAGAFHVAHRREVQALLPA